MTGLTDIDDNAAALLVRVGGGDSATFVTLYEIAAPKLFGVILRILRDKDESEDVLQDVFVTIWRKAAEYDPTRSRAMTWLTTIARNRAIDRYRLRAGRGHQPLEQAAEVADSRPLPDAAAEQRDMMSTLDRALATLEPRHAAAIRSAYLQGMTYEAMAARDGVPVGTLKTWVYRGMAKVRAGWPQP